jgi:phenylalanyl-tRNA synthetase alpha chain
MKELLLQLAEEINGFEFESASDIDQFRQRFTSKKGALALLFEQFRTVPAAEKKETGLLINEIKKQAELKLQEALSKFQEKKEKQPDTTDYSLPMAIGDEAGSRHPLLIIQDRIVSIFAKLGFGLATGPEIEDDWHNFSGLNFPENHPARDMQDTFFVEAKDGGPYALRTHTSSVQIRLMESKQPPLRAIMPGRVYRNEAISARAHCFFHQVEGVYIDEQVSFADLKQTLFHFVQQMFGGDFKVRFRPSYFPFTEPSAEMDISCLICKGEGCRVCKHTGWVEILGCGMIDPEVLRLNQVDPVKYSGFAFGMGIERITMLMYDVKDLRVFSTNDTRFLRQFTAV